MFPIQGVPDIVYDKSLDVQVVQSEIACDNEELLYNQTFYQCN